MLLYLLKRAGSYLVMIFLTTTATYFLAVSTMKPALLEQEKIPRPTPEQVQANFTSLGLDPIKNPWERYVDWLVGVVTRWDWGRSPNGGFVNAQFGDRVWVSTRLILVSLILTIIIGIALGVYSAARQYKISDRVITGYSYFVYILPAPIGYFLIQLLAIKINEWTGAQTLFVTGISSVGVEPGWPTIVDLAAHYLVPTFALTILGWQGYQVAQRQYLLDNINADFVRTARAKGLTRNQAIRKHALRVSFIPVAQSIAFSIPLLFTGAFFAEQIFAWPGIGKWSLDVISAADVNGTVATVTFGSVVFAVGAVLADFATTLVDPRVRVS
ncbi:ABC transporter permease [Psychromicrobium sp. YIM B11713]|uniref:ABC transporter permease n=1 Tax=Psychromicrobium sp. YIM B11713 TaxID=3145233 RepID=UPI00374F7FEF